MTMLMSGMLFGAFDLIISQYTICLPMKTQNQSDQALVSFFLRRTALYEEHIDPKANNLHLSPCPTTPSSCPPLRTESPFILALEFVVQRLNPLRLLPLAQSIRRRNLEKRRRRFDQPFRLDRATAMHVLFRRLDKAVVHDVFGGFSEERRARMQVYGRSFDESLVPLRGVFACGVAEEA